MAAVPLLDAIRDIGALPLVQQSNYGIVASCAFLVYDVILILPEEITHIWSTKWSFPKFIYLFIRYYGIVYLVLTTIISLRVNNSYQICGLYDFLILYAGFNLFSALANIINALRLHALYNGSRTVLISFLFLTAGQFAAGLYTSVELTITTRNGITFPTDIVISGCPVSYNPQVMWAAWAFNLFNTSVSFILTIWDFARSVRRVSRLPCSSSKNSGVDGVGPLLLVFVQDGSIHYISVLAALLVFLFFAIVAPSPLGYASCSWVVAMYSFSATRLILNLRIYAARQQQGGSTWQQTLSLRIRDQGVSEEDAEDAVELNSFRPRA